ncbi:nicotinate-nucleotide adenylyltransferase [Methanomicrobiaceae archaeon CYW5]|uniref:nicotinamide-nucleotide adenylyltransferase n=1 Tax=Methanovulcanius yangii TaxID=1789227 RepID=UPI0029C9F679|nr:nicotinamide-nucleotide adenylyltransferase [Methanovulcanius yangii]MBT8507859.1 nicotinate-nucleotide adenylyltransferase [Methanovulcanius yangii]
MKNRGFYIGRFQPYHNGHQSVLERIAEDVDEIVIGVGSAQFSHTVNNPFTAGERVMMITRALEDLGCPYYVIPIEDIQRNALWVAHVRSISPPFEHVFSSNPLVVRLFKEQGIDVISPAMLERHNLSGTEIRRRMLAGERWEELIPPVVAEIIDEIDGVARLQQIAKTD